MIVWNWVKEKKVADISLKKRKEGNVVIVYGKNLEICYLNKVAGELLMMAKDNISIEEISNKLIAKYDVDEYTLHTDIIEIIRDLQWKRIIRLEG